MIRGLLFLFILYALIQGMFNGVVPVGFNMQTNQVYYINEVVK